MKTVPLTRGKVAIVDDTDYEHVVSLRWCFDGLDYAIHRHPDGTMVRMHRFLMLPGPGEQVDHINGDGLDNRRANLRVCTQSQNNANQRKTRGTSRFKGVSWAGELRKWYATTKINGRQLNLGHFEDETEAARAYDQAAKRLFGPFARLNFPEAT